MSKRVNVLLLQDISEAIEKVLSYTKGMSFEEFISDDKTMDAVHRNFEIIGEAANKVSDDYKQTNSNIEWYKLTALRNRIIHEYFGVDNSIIWNIIQNNIQSFNIEILKLINEETSSNE